LRVRLRYFLWILAALAISVLALAAVAVWRLSQGPVNLALLAPHVEMALSRPERGYRVQVDSVEAAWAGWKRLLRFRVSEAKLVNLEGVPLVETQGLEFVLSASGVLSGRIVPREVELLGVSATLRRRTDGAVTLLAASGTKTEGKSPEIDLRGLLAPGRADGMPDLAGFGVRRAALIVVDDIMDAKWSVPQLDLSFRDGADGTIAEGAASLRLGQAETDVGFTLSSSGEAGGPSLSARLHGLRPQDIAGAHPLLALLGHVTTPLSGNVTVHLAPDFAVVALGADLHGAGGALVDSADTGRSVPVDGLAIRARAVDGLTRLEIEAVEVKALGHTARLSGAGGRQDETLSAFTHLEDVLPELLLPLMPARFAIAAALDAPVSGTVAWTFDSEFRPSALDAGLNIGTGELRVGGSGSDAVAVEGGSALFQMDLAAGQVLVEKLELDLGRGQVEAVGSAKRMESAWNMHLEAEAAAIPVDDLRLLWPPDIGSPGARDWVVSNLSRGRIDGAGIVVDADIAVEHGFDVRTPEIDGSLSFSGVTARYWRPLPPFEDIYGTATFDAKSFALTLSGGKYRDIAIAGAKVDFVGLNREKPPSRLAVDARFEGPLNRVLEVLDREPLGYARYLQMDPAAARGDAGFRLRVGLPLLEALVFDDVEVEAEGEAGDVHMPITALRTNLEGARIDVKVDKRHFAVSGGGSLGGQPATFDFERRFLESEPVESRYRLRTTVDDSGRARLGFDLSPYVNGPIEIDVAATEFRAGTADYTVKAGLGKSEVQLDPLGWAKPGGEPAWLEASLRGGPEGQLEASSVVAAGPGLELVGRGRYDIADNRLIEGSLDRLRLGERTDIAVDVLPTSDGAVSIRVSGPSVDLSGYLGGKDGERSPREGGDRLGILLDTDRAWLGGDAPLHGFSAQFRLEGERLLEGTAEALTEGGRAVSVSLRPDADKARLTIEAEDTGALLSALGWYRNMRGGLLRFNAAGPAGALDDYEGSLLVKDFRIRNAPVLARLLAAASITGIGDALSSDAGLRFERLETPVRIGNRHIGLGPGRAFGTSIGVTFRGEFDRDRETVALDGVLVPAYFVSRVLEKIPLIGGLLTRGGEGLFAATYELDGPVDDPRTKVNPLTVLAPGFLRGLFGPLLGAEGRDWNPDEPPDGKSTR